MSKKPIIAIDIDDVLAASAASWVDFSNKTWNTDLEVKDYDEDWAKMWRVDFETARERASLIHQTQGLMTTFRPDETARATLLELAKRYDLVIATSRVSTHEAETLAWIDRYFNGIFSALHLANIYIPGKDNRGSIDATKAALIDKIGADYLIDDQLKHCLAVAAAGRQAVLFGDYSWNQTVGLPSGVTRCKDWKTVMEYFDGRR